MIRYSIVYRIQCNVWKAYSSVAGLVEVTLVGVVYNRYVRGTISQSGESESRAKVHPWCGEFQIEDFV